MDPAKLNLQQKNPYTRSVSGTQFNASKASKSKPKTTIQMVRRFVTNVGNFFKRIFSFSASKSKVASSNMNPQSQLVTSTSFKEKPVISMKQMVDEKLAKTFGSTDNLITQLKTLGLDKEVSELNELLRSGSASDINQIESFTQKVHYHEELKKVNNFIDQTPLKESPTFESFKSSILKMNHSDADLSKLNETVRSFKQSLKKELTGSNSVYKTQINTIKGDVLKSTESYVKSGEFDHKRLVSSLYQSSTQLINYAVSKRKSTIVGLIKKHEPQLSPDQVEEKFSQITKLYTEKHFHLTASTLQGDQYIKGWASGGRTDTQIMSDVHSLLGSNSEYLNAINHSYDSLLKGLDKTIPGSSQALVDAAYQNDTMIACMKTIHEMTLGFEQHIDGLVTKDFSKLSLDSLSKDIKRSNLIMANFKVLSTDFVVGEKDMTHLSRSKIEQMITAELSNVSFSNDASQSDFSSKMTDYVLNRLEYKGAIDSESNDYGMLHQSLLGSLKVKNSMLLEMDEFKVFDQDKSKTFFGSVYERGPFSRGFKALESGLKSALAQHFQQPNATATLSDIQKIVANILQSENLTANGIDRTTEIVDLLTRYTDTLLKKEGIISTGDAGLVKALKPRSYFSSDSKFVLKSNKNDFLTSDFYKDFAEQFDAIAPVLDQKINDFLQAALHQGQTGKLRSLVKELQSRPRNWLSENILFKKEVLKNRLQSFLTGESTANQTDILKDVYNANSAVQSMTNDAVDDPEKMLDQYQEKLSRTDEQISQQVSEMSESSSQAIDAMGKQMSLIQSHIDNLLHSKFSQSLQTAQGDVNSRDSTVQEAALSLTDSVANVESDLQGLRQILVDAGHVALDQVDDILMSVPYVGELYSALQMVNDVRNVGSSQLKMDANQSKFDTVTGFNRYVVADSSLHDVSDNVAVFSSFMQAEQKRDAAAFSLMVHVGNALSPPGVNVGSLLKVIKNAVSLPDLSQEDMDKISQEVVTVNQNYTALATTEKSVGLQHVIDSLDSGKLEDFTRAIYDVATHLPDASDIKDALNSSFYN